jgi:anti-anti-sigma factor
MGAMTHVIEVERQGGTLVLTPLRDLRELDFQGIEAERDEILWRWEHDPSLRDVVVDLGRTDSVGWTAVGMLTWLQQRVRGRGGHLVLCNLSAHERDILTGMGLARSWPVFASRAEAVQAVDRGARARDRTTRTGP